MVKKYANYPTVNDVPDNPYTVVYDAEYTGFKPFNKDHGYERTGQTVSVFSPELQRDDFFAIRELRTYELDVNGRGLRKSVIDVLSKDAFVNLVESGFDINFTGGRPVGTSDVTVNRLPSSSGTVLGQWPSQAHGYTEAVTQAVFGKHDFDFDSAGVFEAVDIYNMAMKHVDLNPGPMRGTLITPEDIRSELNWSTPWVVNTYDFYSKLSSDQSSVCNARVAEHEQVRKDHPSTLLDRLSFMSTTRAVEVVPWTETLESVGAVSVAKPADLVAELGNGFGSRYDDRVASLDDSRDRSFE